MNQQKLAIIGKLLRLFEQLLLYN